MTDRAQNALPTAGKSMGGMLALRLAAQVVTLSVSVILTRVLGPEEFGRYAFLISYLTLFSLFNANGLNDILVREIASRPAERDRIYRTGLLAKLAAGLTAYGLAMLLASLLKITDLPWWVVAIGGITLFVSFSMGSTRTVWDVPYQVDFRMARASAYNLTAKLLFAGSLVAWLALVRFSHHKASLFLSGVAMAVILQVGSEVLGMGFQAVGNIRLGYPMIPRRDREVIRYLVRETWPLAVAGGLVMLYTQVNVLMVRYFLTHRQVGLFAAPKRLCDALLLIPTVYQAVSLPILASLGKGRPDASGERLVALGYRTLLALGGAIVAVALFYSHDIIQLLYGADYLDSAPVLGVLMISTVIYFNLMALTGLLIVTGEQRSLMLLYAVQAVVNVVANLILIPYAGILGAAWAAVATFAVAFIAGLASVRIRWTALLWLRNLPAPAIAATAAGLAGRWLGLKLLPAMVLVPITFLMANALMGGFGLKDLRLGGEVIRSRSTDYYREFREDI